MKITNDNGALIIIEEKACEDSFEVKMLTNNSFANFLRVKLIILDNVRQYEYDTFSKMDLRTYMERNTLKVADIKAFLRSIKEALRELSRYMIDSNRVIISPDTVFVKDNRFYFIVLPGFCEFDKYLRHTLESMLEHVDYKDNTAVVLMYKLYHGITREGLWIGEIDLDVDEPDEEKPESVPVVMNFNENDPPIVKKKFKIDTITGAMAGLSVIFIIASMLDGIFPIPLKFSILCAIITAALTIYLLKKDFEKCNIKQEKKVDVCMDYEGLTTVLTKLPPFLVCEDELEAKIPINTVPFILGSGKENVDYRFNRRSVSRLHARIFAEGDRYFIEDLDSTNGTRVNKKKLAPHEIVEIRDGDIITISDVEMSYYNS